MILFSVFCSVCFTATQAVMVMPNDYSNRPSSAYRNKDPVLRPKVVAASLSNMFDDIGGRPVLQESVYNETERLKICWSNVLYVNETDGDADSWHEFQIAVYSPPESQPRRKLSNKYRDYGIQMADGKVMIYQFEVVHEGSNYIISRHVNTSCGEGRYLTKTYSEQPDKMSKAVVFRLKDEPHGGLMFHHSLEEEPKDLFSNDVLGTARQREEEVPRVVYASKKEEPKEVKSLIPNDVLGSTRQREEALPRVVHPSKKPFSGQFRPNKAKIPSPGNMVRSWPRGKVTSSGSSYTTLNYDEIEHNDINNKQDRVSGNFPGVYSFHRTTPPTEVIERNDADVNEYLRNMQVTTPEQIDGLATPTAPPVSAPAPAQSTGVPSVSACSPLLAQLFSGHAILPGLCNLTTDEKVVLRGDIIVSRKFINEKNVEVMKPLFVIHENTEIESRITGLEDKVPDDDDPQ